MVYIAERKHSVFRTVSCTIKDLILAATALLPIGPNINDEFLRTSDSALGAKVKALNLIETYHLKNVMTDETALDLFCSLIGAHLFYNQSLFDVTLEETFLVLEVEGKTTSNRISEPAFSLILEPIFRITVTLIDLLIHEPVPAYFSNKISPSFVASLVPLLLSPIYNERAYILKSLELAIVFLDEAYDIAILKAFDNYIDNIIIRKLPLRGVNEILEFMDLMLNKNAVKSEKLTSVILNLVHSKIFPLYRHKYFYFISDLYRIIIGKTLDVFYRNPAKAQAHIDAGLPQLFAEDSDYFLDHPFVRLCRRKYFQNIPRGDCKNEAAIVGVIETLTSLNGFFHKSDIQFMLKSFIRHMKYSAVSDFAVLIFGLLQVETLKDLDPILLRKTLQTIWTSDFTTEAPAVTQLT